MTSVQQPLLRIRLDVLINDINKVEGAIDRAKQRGHELDDVIRVLDTGDRSVIRLLQQLSTLNRQVSDALNLNDDIGDMLDDAEGPELRQRIEAAGADFSEVNDNVVAVRKELRRIRTTILAVNRRFDDKNGSLQKECGELRTAVQKILTRVVAAGDDARQQRGFWTEYEKLLVDSGRPLFGEYVDFLGGLTMRDTGLDDRVCEMTDVLLGGFATVIGHFVPIPSRTAALSSALDSVVKLGFPEWSLWGVPLVAHEVGLALRSGWDVQELMKDFADHATKEQLVELFADVFGSHTVGPAYGYAALMLRLHPHHDEPARDNEARDVDRARLILLALKYAGEDSGSGYQQEVERLREIWTDAVVTKAGPEHADKAAADASGPPPEIDWLDDFAQAAREVLKARKALVPFNELRWAQTAKIWAELVAGREMVEETDDLLAVLNHAWAARVRESATVSEIAQQVEAMWNGRKRLGRSK